MKKAKRKKIIKTPKQNPNNFILSCTNIIGIEDNFVKIKSGFISIVKVYGIDILHYKESDKEYAMMSFAHALKSCEVKHKIVFINVRPSFSNQIMNINNKLRYSENKFRKHILDRQINFLKYYEQNLLDRIAYILFFSEEKTELKKAMELYINSVTSEICSEKDIIEFMTAYIGGDNINEIT